jgi:predicted metal-dependent hydrolase
MGVELLGETVEYDVRRSEDASESRIDVDIHGVTVVVPVGSEVVPRELLRENAAWVLEKRRKYQRYREEAPERSFEVGAVFPYLGVDREVQVAARGSHAVTAEAIVLRRSAVEQSTVKRVLKNFYRQRAREYFSERAEEFAERMGVSYTKIEIRNQRTKWGSCSSSGTLGLNWRLMMAPSEVVDYIIVHELAHLREANHGEAFWRLVREYDPEYEEHAEWLRENSVELIFSEADL